ncbi:thiamine phosphate synthase [Antarcticirhabdus aurantiaca]|uniref:Thiamine phosphate synthase n=1 Tax=Antarcticirhabdus aurantiaca TaxID=2606717 RepID=A0ACD4NR08_9HYPH|nr:thiamine phosphate synthase [Antarcticirhabdus aurantiaca]WAJ29365.1 thiamine phosphate synthase [Jeongeuplla avenae]
MIDLSLYVLLDAGAVPPERLPDLARTAAENGATLLQYRDKTASTRAMVARASAIRAALAGSGVPLLVNDRVDVALASGTEGVHLGRDDMAPDTARRILGASAIVGVTVKNADDARGALHPAVDYACIGGVFETLSKANPEPPVGIEGFRTLRNGLRDARPDLPVGAIAGIDAERAAQLVAAGADGVAVISAVLRAADPAAAARALRAAVDAAKGEAAR